MFRHVARLLAIAVLFAAGCEDATFDLLPPKPKAAGAGGGGGDMGAAGEAPGTGGTRSGTGGAAAGHGGAAAGGAGLPNAGTGGLCVGPDCVPDCTQDGGVCPQPECVKDEQCPGKETCFGYRCVECQSGKDCAPGQICELHTNVCVYYCDKNDKDIPPCPDAYPYCEQSRRACVECRGDNDPNCSRDKPLCNWLEKCVECTSPYDCPDEMPACSTLTFTCGPCLHDYDCPRGKKCDENKRCVLVSPPPPDPQP